MGKQHPNMAQTLKRWRRAIEQEINERALRLGEETSENIATSVIQYAKDLLKQRTNSSPKIMQIAESFRVEDATGENGKGRAVFSSTKNKKKRLTGKVVKFPVDKDKLIMFLEYGTGIKGKNNPHPEAGAFGWEYAINDRKTKETMKRYGYINYENGEKVAKSRTIFRNQEWYVDKFGERGFIFKYKGNEYLDKDDIIFKNMHDGETSDGSYYTKLVTPKSGKQKPYWRRNRVNSLTATKSQYVFSQGIEPVRFIYDTRKNGVPEIIETIRNEFMR